MVLYNYYMTLHVLYVVGVRWIDLLSVTVLRLLYTYVVYLLTVHIQYLAVDVSLTFSVRSPGSVLDLPV